MQFCDGITFAFKKSKKRMTDLKQSDLPNANPNGHNNENIGSGKTTEENDTSTIYLGDSKLQTEEEFELDKNKQEGDKEKVTASGIDDLQSNSDGAAGTDRAGTAERKPFGDTKLNQGLEEQGQE
jgi:hypothetical protein